MIRITLFPNASLQCDNDGVQNFMFYGNREIPRRYFPKGFDVTSIELHGLRDTSESAYAGVVYIRATNVDIAINHTALMIAKTKVARSSA